MTTHQRGSALVFSLIILLVMTMIGITALSTSTLEEKMAANDRNQRIAFQTAEAALREGEAELAANTLYLGEDELREDYDGMVGYYYDTAYGSEWGAGADCIAATIEGFNNTATACYKVENIGLILPLEMQEYPYQVLPHIGRVSARGADANDQTAVTVQSYYRVELTNPSQ